MTLIYSGNRNKYTNGERLGEMFCEDHEEQRKDEIALALQEKGWTVYLEQNWAGFPVYDKQEFNELMAEYKELKKVIK